MIASAANRIIVFFLYNFSRSILVESFTILSRGVGIRRHSFTYLNYNIYDEWRSDTVRIDTLPLDEETVQMCLNEFIYSDFGSTMFGIHDAPGTFGPFYFLFSFFCIYVHTK
jgi:hypothetical protein